MSPEAHFEEQRIDTAIKEAGFCLVNEKDLALLFGDDGAGRTKFPLLARLAHEREWNFEFHPRDGEVRISLLPRGKNGQSSFTEALT